VEDRHVVAGVIGRLPDGRASSAFDERDAAGCGSDRRGTSTSIISPGIVAIISQFSGQYYVDGVASANRIPSQGDNAVQRSAGNLSSG
jgi:hypothetical protein